jgi:hypothetical protein
MNEYTNVGQHMTDVLEPETMLVLMVVNAFGQTIGPMLQLVNGFEIVLPPSASAHFVT